MALIQDGSVRKGTFFSLQVCRDFTLNFEAYERVGKYVIKDDFQSVLRSLSILMFTNIVNLTRWNANRCYSLRTSSLS